jgi:hypothetical protein
MSPFADRLPDHFPVGTRYIIEGRGGSEGRLQVHLRYLEFPDGRRVTLPVETPRRAGEAPTSAPPAGRSSTITLRGLPLRARLRGRPRKKTT